MISSEEPSWFAEEPIGGFQQRAEVRAKLFEGASPYQSIGVYDTVPFGRTLVLSGAIQTTVGDEFVYHEMLVHPALLAHAHPERVLIIGGGDGGTARRVLEHGGTSVTMVEIDRDVVNLSLKYLPEISAGALDDARATVLIADGTRYIADTADRFDVVLVDSTDPVGPAKALFDAGFYRNVARVLNDGGLLVTQSGSPLLMQQELGYAVNSLQTVFPFVRCYLANIPSYPGCLWSFLAAARDAHAISSFSSSASSAIRATIAKRFANAGLQTKYYTPDLHFASCALPAFIERSIGSGRAGE